jgi:hypothetical protein
VGVLVCTELVGVLLGVLVAAWLVGVLVGVFVGVFVDTRVFVGGGVLVDATRVLVGVLLGGTGVFVAGTGVFVPLLQYGLPPWRAAKSRSP